MASSSTSDRGEKMDANADGTSNSTQPGLAPREGQPPRGITAMSQQQDESTELTGVLREQRERPVSGFSGDIRAGTVSLRVSVSCERPGPVPSAGNRGGAPSISRDSHLPPLEQPRNVPPNHSQQSPPLHNPAILAGPGALPLQQNQRHGGPVPERLDYQQFRPFQGQGRLLGQPPLHRQDQSGRQPTNPPAPQLPFPFLPFSYPVLVFGQAHDRMGRTGGLAQRNSAPLSAGRDMGHGVRQLLPGWPYPVVLQSSMYLPTRPQVYPQTSFQTNPQMPPQTNAQISSQMQIRGPVPTNLGAPSGPPPPYPGPSLAPGEPMPATNRAGPSTDRRQIPGTSRTSAIPQPRSLRSGPNDGPENDGTGLDVGGEAAERARTRTNPPRRARATKPYEQD